jgi:hypothetical protein
MYHLPSAHWSGGTCSRQVRTMLELALHMLAVSTPEQLQLRVTKVSPPIVADIAGVLASLSVFPLPHRSGMSCTTCRSWRR